MELHLHGPEEFSPEREAQICTMCPTDMGSGVPPGNQIQGYQRDRRPMPCKQADCTRRAHSRGCCTTHYRRWRSGRDLGSPVRGYVRYEEVRTVTSDQQRHQSAGRGSMFSPRS